MPRKALAPFRDRAAALLGEPAALPALLAEAQLRAAHSPALRDMIPGLCRLVAAHSSGDYDEADEEEAQLALAAILYVVSPWDQAPDYLPDGLRDDEVVTRSVVLELECALRVFEAWRVPPASRPRRRV